LTYMGLSMPSEECGPVVCPRCDGWPRRVSACHDSRTKSPAVDAPVASAHDKILIVDFGSQVTQLIARRVREEGVYSEIVPFQKAEAAFKEMKPKAVILSGRAGIGARERLAARAAAHFRFPACRCSESATAR